MHNVFSAADALVFDGENAEERKPSFGGIYRSLIKDQFITKNLGMPRKTFVKLLHNTSPWYLVH